MSRSSGCGVGANVVTLLFGEFVKVLCVILLLFITAQLYANPELARFDYFADGGGEQLLHPVV